MSFRRLELARLATRANAWSWAMLAAASVACGSAREAEAQKSAARIARAIEVLREAPNAAKAAPLRELARLACSAADVCETRDICQSAYAMHVEAIALTGAAKLHMAEGRTADAAKLLTSAEHKLAEASRKVSSCAEREGTLRRRYNL